MTLRNAAIGLALAGLAAGPSTLAFAQASAKDTLANPAKEQVPGKAFGPQGDTWDSIKQLPDWGGLWEGVQLLAPPGPPPKLTPEYQAKLDAYKAAQKRGEEVQSQHANCVPYAYPSSMGIYPFEYLFTPGKVTVAIETDSQMRRIYTSGHMVPADPDETFQGYSVGHWEGDTLVDVTVGLVPQMEIIPGVGHSDQLRILERAHLIAPDRLEITWTYTDPKVLTEPYVQKRVYARHRDWDLQEYNCQQNNHDASDALGRPSMTLNGPNNGSNPHEY